MDSILKSVKVMLGGIPLDDPVFDQELIFHINSALSNLTLLGVGPKDGYAIENASDEWYDFLDSDDPKLSLIKQYVHLKVKQVFDTSTTSGAVIEMYKEMIKELEWKINVIVEENKNVS